MPWYLNNDPQNDNITCCHGINQFHYCKECDAIEQRAETQQKERQLITTSRGERIEPDRGMKVKSLYTGNIYEIFYIKWDSQVFYTPDGDMLPLGLDWELVEQ